MQYASCTQNGMPTPFLGTGNHALEAAFHTAKDWSYLSPFVSYDCIVLSRMLFLVIFSMKRQLVDLKLNSSHFISCTEATNCEIQIPEIIMHDQSFSFFNVQIHVRNNWVTTLDCSSNIYHWIHIHNVLVFVFCNIVRNVRGDMLLIRIFLTRQHIPSVTSWQFISEPNILLIGLDTILHFWFFGFTCRPLLSLHTWNSLSLLNLREHHRRLKTS